MDAASTDDPIADLNQVLSEVIDLVQDVKQAHRKVPETHALHALLDQVFADLRTWAGLLMDTDEALGVSALGQMPSVAGRPQRNLWPGTASDEDVRRVVGGDLDRLAQHVAIALAAQQDDGARATLTQVQQGILADQEALHSQ